MGTVQETMAKVGEIFRANMGYNPHHGEHDGTIALCLKRQFKGMPNHDPKEHQQKALPVRVYHHMLNSASSPLEQAIAHLFIGAFFFTMHSYKYVCIPANTYKQQEKDEQNYYA